MLNKTFVRPSQSLLNWILSDSVYVEKQRFNALDATPNFQKIKPMFTDYEWTNKAQQVHDQPWKVMRKYGY